MHFLLPILAVLAQGDPELLRRLNEGDPKALADAYDTYGSLVFRVIARMVSDPGVAEELVQDTFLRLWNRANLLEPGSSLGPWIITIARHRAIDYLRSTGGRLAAHQFQLENIEHGAVFATVHHDFTNSPHKWELKEAIGKLGEKQRTAIDLAYYEGLSHTEIAERLKQPLGTVKSWIRSGLQTLRIDLEERKRA